MLGLFGTLHLGARSIQTHQKGAEVAGHNLANVNNPAYARQRLVISAADSIRTQSGQQGTGVDGVTTVQVRNAVLERQLTREGSVLGSLEAQQSALDQAEASLGDLLSRRTADGISSASLGSGSSLGEGLGELFNGFQNLSTQPTSLAERQVLLAKATELANKFNSTDKSLSELQISLDDSISNDVTNANRLLDDIARLNQHISRVESGSGDAANDLRDQRQQKLDELGMLTNVELGSDDKGSITLSIAGVELVSGSAVLDRLETTGNAGATFVRTATGQQNLAFTAGSIHGSLEARDGALQQLRAKLSNVANVLITEVNAVHSVGFGLAGTTGAAFFTGSGAADISVNANLTANPALVQASNAAGTPGNNSVALNLAQLATKSQASLQGLTFQQSFSAAVGAFSLSLNAVRGEVTDQKLVHDMLTAQRNSISGVSIDEELIDLTKFQKGFAASARLVSMVDEMLDTVINL